MQRIWPSRGRINALRAGGAIATADDIGADDKKTAGVHRLARANHRIPPSGMGLPPLQPRIVLGLRIPPGDMGVSGERMTNQYRIVTRRRQLAVDLILDGQLRQRTAVFQCERLVRRRQVTMTGDCPAHRVRRIRRIELALDFGWYGGGAVCHQKEPLG